MIDQMNEWSIELMNEWTIGRDFSLRLKAAATTTKVTSKEMIFNIILKILLPRIGVGYSWNLSEFRKLVLVWHGQVISNKCVLVLYYLKKIMGRKKLINSWIQCK